MIVARLSTIKPRLSTIKPLIGREPGDEAGRNADRDANLPWRAWYKTARWQKLRWSALLRDRFTCCKCGRVEGNTSQLVGDHVIPHRGDEQLFWDIDNIQCLCRTCHDTEKRIEERRAWLR